MVTLNIHGNITTQIVDKRYRNPTRKRIILQKQDLYFALPQIIDIPDSQVFWSFNRNYTNFVQYIF